MRLAKNRVTRLSKYKTVLKRLKSVGMDKVFADNIADAAGVSSAQVRKDFSIFGLSGSKKGGYYIDDIIAAINHLLGKSEIIRVILVGYGNIGRSILNYPGFAKANIRICAAFDIRESKVDRESDPPVLHVNEMGEFIRSNDVKIAVLAVPEHAAQKTMNRLVEEGIKGVLNFTPVVLKAPDDVFINDIDLVQALETIIFYTHSPLKNLG